METIHKHFPWITPDEEVWLQDQLMRRAATGFEQAELWSDAAECWADLGEHTRAADLYARAGDLSRAANANLDAGRYEDALDDFVAWAEALSARDFTGRVECLLGQACCHLLGTVVQKSDGRFSRAAGRDLYRQGRATIEEADDISPLQHARAWNALAGYGKRLGRHDLVELAYEQALALLDGTGAGSEHLRLVEDYHAMATAWEDRTLAQSLAERLAALAPLEETPAWEAQRAIIESQTFDDGLHDVLHFTSDVQWQAWAQLAEMDEDEPYRDNAERNEVDDYLRSLAPEGMVYIPAGRFLVGSADDDPDADDDEKPQHELWLRGYYMDRYPVTNGQFRLFLEAGGYENQAQWTEAGWQEKESQGWTEPRYWDDERFTGERKPVVGLSWYEAVAYANWAGKALPSEAEWEKAAGWDPIERRKRTYPWGDEWDATKSNSGGRESTTTEVGAYPDDMSAYGIGDVAGNVDEWLSTRWSNDEGQIYSYPFDFHDGREDAKGGNSIPRHIRAAGWFGSKENAQRWARCGFRNWLSPGFRFYVRGFRCLVPHVFSVFDPGS